MIIFREKLFTYKTLDDVFYIGSKRACLEIMKCLEMFQSGALGHWIVDKIEKLPIKEANKSFNISPVSLLSPAIENRRGGQLLNIFRNSNLLNKFSEDFPNPESYVSFIKTELLTETRNGEPKYKNHFDRFGFKYSIEEYCDFYKYIALCLSGQLDPRVDEFDWNIEKVIRPMKVNYTSCSNLGISNILAQCIYNISRRYDSNITFSSIGFGKLLF